MGHVQVHQQRARAGRPPPPPPAPRRRWKPPPLGLAAQQPNPPRCRAPSRALPRDPWRHGRAALGGAAEPSPPALDLLLPPRGGDRPIAALRQRGLQGVQTGSLGPTSGPTFSGLRVAGTAVRLSVTRSCSTTLNIVQRRCTQVENGRSSSPRAIERTYQVSILYRIARRTRWCRRRVVDPTRSDVRSP